MGPTWLAIGSALWLGILTSISPCPLATNIAAVSYVGRRIGSARAILASGALYTAGRTVAYVALGAAAVWSLTPNPGRLSLTRPRRRSPTTISSGPSRR